MDERFRRYRADMIGHTLKTSSRQIFIDILNFCCDLDLKHKVPFFHRTLQPMMLYRQTRFVCKPTSSLEDTTEMVIFWSYKPSLWPRHWTQWTNFSAWHCCLWCCITIPGLATKYSVVQKISSGKTFTNIFNLHCDLDLERSNPIFPQDTPAYDTVLSNQVWLQIRRYGHTLII